MAEAFRHAVDDLLEQRPDLIVIAGDVFHSVRPTNPAILHLFQQLQRVRATLPNTPVVIIAGEHDTPRSLETGAILRLYEALGIDIAIETSRRVVFPKLDCAVLARLQGKKIMVGCLDLSDKTVEAPQQVADRIRKALQFLKKEDVILAPDCGMKYLPREVAFGKMKAMVEGAKILRTEVV